MTDEQDMPRWYVVIYELPPDSGNYIVAYMHNGPGRHQVTTRESIPATVEAALQAAKDGEER